MAVLSKQEARKRARLAVASLDAEARRRAAEAIGRRVASSEPWRRASTILLYAALPDEVDTAPLIARARREGKRIALPRVAAGRETFDAALWGASETWTEGPWGLRQPPDSAPSLPVSELDLIVAPGRAFDTHGRRVGRGGGMYDRFLAHPRRTARVVGVAFSCQIAPEGVEADPDRDVPVDALATETAFRCCAP